MEDSGQQEILNALNCREMLGLLIGMPVPRERLKALLAATAKTAAFA